MPTLTIDGKEVEIAAGATVLQACEAAGVEVPRFCYHERLSIAGNCRMCLVEMEKSPKPVASCAMPVAEGMVVRTATPEVRKARQGVMEFLLINHPLDCPICDQGGECDLQDQAMAYGVDASRFSENKRAVEDKDMGPLIKTVMTRCIHCTRCVRFATEVAGAPELGALGRGEDMEISTALDQAVCSEMSGNMIDLCPVGALTSKPYAFTARSWELQKTETVDVMDALGCSIRVDARGREVMRILPRVNEAINEEWISDKTRFVWDGLACQRLDRPFVRDGGRLREASWDEAFRRIADAVADAGSGRVAAIAGDLACAESMQALKDLMGALGSPHLDCRQDGASIGRAGRGGYLFNSTIAAIDDIDALLLVGADPRREAAVLNARILKRTRQTPMPVACIGTMSDPVYPVRELGDGPQALRELLRTEEAFFKTPASAQKPRKPMMIVGMGALARPDGDAIFNLCLELAQKAGVITAEWNGFNVLHTAAARVAGLDLNFLPGANGRDTSGIISGAQSGDIRVLYLLGADELPTDDLGDAFVIYQGSHGDAGAHRADVVLPAAAWTEKNATWVNTEGRIRRSRRAVAPPGDAREDWTIIRALSDVLNCTLPYDDLSGLRKAMNLPGVNNTAPPVAIANAGEAGDAPFIPPVGDFYLTNPVARASVTMAACSRRDSRRDKVRNGHG